MKTNSEIQPPPSFCARIIFPRCSVFPCIYICFFPLSLGFSHIILPSPELFTGFEKDGTRSPSFVRQARKEFPLWKISPLVLQQYINFLVRSRTVSVYCYITISKTYCRQRMMTRWFCLNGATELYLLVLNCIYTVSLRQRAGNYGLHLDDLWSPIRCVISRNAY